VHRASRIASAGNGGQVLLSNATRTLVEGSLPDGVELRDLGEHRLKDLERAEHLWQLVIADLPSEFPPIASLDAVPNNLPTRVTTFLGRETEIGEITELLARSRMLTLTGPGGTGKTRLSLEVAGRTLGRYPGGVFFVELAPIVESELVIGTIAQSLRLPDRAGRSTGERLTDYIGDQRVLLVLDNFEQVLSAGPSVTGLLEVCRNLTVMISSRSVLHVSGEQEYPVPPLGLPDPANLPPLTQLGQYEAVALFIERARSVKPAFEVTNENAPAVAEISVRLDGLPLAIELAAARIRIFTPQAMLSRLEHRLGLLAGGSRDLPARQQTLRGAIAWSHEMLSESDRSLFACLSVFVDGAGLDAIERVCSAEVAGDLIESLTSLVDQSLVRQSEGVGAEPRFGMLQTIREFAIEQAVEAGRWDGLRANHAALLASIAEDAAAYIMGSAKGEWLDRLEQEHDNLRAAIAWAVEQGAVDTAMRIESALWRFWQMRGHLVEGLERIEQTLALPRSHDHLELRADALSAAAGLAYWLADVDRSRTLYEDEIATRTRLGDRAGLAEAHYGISFTWAVFEREDAASEGQARAHIKSAIAIFREIGDDAGVGRCEWALANVVWGTGDMAEARRHAEEALVIFIAVDDRFMVGWTSYTLGLAEVGEESGGPDEPQHLADARRWLTDALRIFDEAHDLTGYALVIDAMAVLALRAGDRRRAARLSGAVEQFERTSGIGLNLWNRSVLQFDPGQLRDDPALADDWASGELMTAAEAVAYALSDSSQG
jgi:predicted ATPase